MKDDVEHQFDRKRMDCVITSSCVRMFHVEHYLGKMDSSKPSVTDGHRRSHTDKLVRYHSPYQIPYHNEPIEPIDT